MGHEILLTNIKTVFIRHGLEQRCPKCGAEDETLIHALKDYLTYQEILSIGGWKASTISKKYSCCIDWLEDMMKVLDKRAMADLMTTLWNCWNNRNKYIFKVGVNKIGYGTIARDDENFVLRGGGSFIEMMMSAKEAKCYAFEASSMSAEY
ncbi:hypothetical protein PVK06_005256 [Gossypium arboreum]|uniref:Uncharacterized protein n=1 Tax=Gossypium arboreum TaxID=29729 RepID=A0ABR0QU51_GOSAR|nr:hypothetical protein PVK06_005256 [Gossypium arboreum]